MEIRLGTCTVRSWRRSDADLIVPHADNRQV